MLVSESRNARSSRVWFLNRGMRGFRGIRGKDSLFRFFCLSDGVFCFFHVFCGIFVNQEIKKSKCDFRHSASLCSSRYTGGFRRAYKARLPPAYNVAEDGALTKHAYHPRPTLSWQWRGTETSPYNELSMCGMRWLAYKARLPVVWVVLAMARHGDLALQCWHDGMGWVFFPCSSVFLITGRICDLFLVDL